MLEDQVANLLQRYLGDYVIGLNKEALKISAWRGDVELTNMQLRPEALNALKLPVKVKAGFLGSVKLKVPWSRLGQAPVVVHLDRIFLLAEPATQVEGCGVDSIQEAKKCRVHEMEKKLLERAQDSKSEVNKSWLGSLINTIIGNLKLSISSIHIRYEDLESNPGHAFSAGVTLEKLSAVTVDDNGREAFATGGALDCIQKTVELEGLALYLDSDITPWHCAKPWEDLLPLEWDQVFRCSIKHTYILQPVSGNANYSKLRPNVSARNGQPPQKAAVNLDDVTLCLSKDAYRDIIKLADNFAAFNQRLKYAHLRPLNSVKHDPRSWWKYACKVLSEQLKMASGMLSWDRVLHFATLRKRYISLYASLLKDDPRRAIVDGSIDIEELDREIDIDLILQWRMLAHEFVEQSMDSSMHSKKQKEQKSWWPFGWSSQSFDSESYGFTEEDWERLNQVIGYNAGNDEQALISQGEGDLLHTLLEIHMNHNASKLVTDGHECVAELSCESFSCSIKLFSETKVLELKLGSYQLSSPAGLLAESATDYDSLVGIFSYMPIDSRLDWSMVAKASPCYVTYLKASIDQIIHFFESNTVTSQMVALETAAAVQMTINEVKRTARQQANSVLKNHTRFLLDLNIAAPKITIPSDFCPDNHHSTKLMLDLGNLVISSRNDYEPDSACEMEIYMQFNLILSDVSAFLVDGDHHWGKIPSSSCTGIDCAAGLNFWPVIDKCGAVVKLQQRRLENPSHPATRLAVRLPSLRFHFSPARYHRLMQVAKIFQKDDDGLDFIRPWDQADFEGWLSILAWKGIANREAVWQRIYLCMVGPFLYILKNPASKSYNQCISLRGKQVYQIPEDLIGGMEYVLAVCDATVSRSKVVEDVNALILRCDFDDLRRAWQRRLQGAVYRASGSVPITSVYENPSNYDEFEAESVDDNNLSTLADLEKVFAIGVLDELKILFSYSQRHDQNFAKVLLSEESHLFEFRAKGGQVELSIKSNDMFIGTVLKSLEIKDLIFHQGVSQPCYLARSFIQSVDAASSFDDAENQSLCINDPAQSDGEEMFFEAPLDLVENESPGSMPVPLGSRQPLSSEIFSMKPPSFGHTAFLIDDVLQTKGEGIELAYNLDSFVKAQIVIFDLRSPRYNNIDRKVTVNLTTLAFCFRRPTMLAIIEFANAINADDDTPSLANKQLDLSEKDANASQQSTTVEESVVKGLLGKGKSRIIFSLSLNMAHAQIFLMKENESKLATLLHENLMVEIKVYPSSFSIKASLGNLMISDDSLHNDHPYYWICDMRDPGGRSLVELILHSFSVDDEDYEGYEYSLTGQLSEVQIVYLNRFVQEILSYFTGLATNNSNGVVKLRDQVTNSDKWFTVSEIEGSAALKLDLSLRKPIILMPRRTESIDYLKLDVVHITIKNTFQWICGSKGEMDAVHMEVMTVLVEDINLSVGIGTELGDSIIQDVEGIAVVVRRTLRDLRHQIPNTEADIKIQGLKAFLSNKEYQIISECVLSNITEDSNLVPPLTNDASIDVVEDLVPPDSGSVYLEPQNQETWTTFSVSVVLDLFELRLHSGVSRDTALATLQMSGAWLLYKSNTCGEASLSATLKGFAVIDDRNGIDQQFRLAVGRPEHIGCNPLHSAGKQSTIDAILIEGNVVKPIPTMLILDAKFGRSSTSVSLCVQRPQLLVALDFLLAFVEFFVPSVGRMLLNEDDDKSSSTLGAIILDQSTYSQPTPELSLSPDNILVADDERFDLFIYDGKSGTLHLQGRDGCGLSASSIEPIIFIGNGKRLQFKNVVIKGGNFLDSCILLGTDSSYSASEDDKVFFEGESENYDLNISGGSGALVPIESNTIVRSKELIIELQATGPELTFFSTSKNVGKSLILSNKLLHAQFDAFCRASMKGDTTEMSANVLGLIMESNGIRILEPLDASVKVSIASGITNISLDVSDVIVNLSFSILRFCLALQADILGFLSMASKKMTVMCYEFDRVGTIEGLHGGKIYAFWRPRAPPGFAVLGDYLTPLDKPPTKGVLAINTGFVKVKKAVSFNRIWPPLDSNSSSNSDAIDYYNPDQNHTHTIGDGICSIWFPVAPKGYVALGCVVSTGRREPLLSNACCILASLVSPGDLRDCITIFCKDAYKSKLAFWRVDNSVGTFLPADPSTLSLTGKAYELRHIFFVPKISPKVPVGSNTQIESHDGAIASGRSAGSFGRHFEAIASFKLVWWNRSSRSIKKLSIWRPVVPQGMVYFGDISVQGYEPPSSCIVLHCTEDDICRAPLGFQFVGKIKKHRGTESISFWLPLAPPGFASLGCIACESMPKEYEFSSLGCVCSDLVTEDHFFEDCLWNTSGENIKREPFSMWAGVKELGTFIVHSGYERPHKRFSLVLADQNLPTHPDDIVIDAKISTVSTALFDEYGGLMIPLCNVSASGIGFSLHGRTDFWNSTSTFSLAARSYNDKHDSWEPLVDQFDGFMRYQYDLCSPGATSQLQLMSTRDLNLNISVSNANMIFQAYASWSDLGHVHESNRKQDAASSADSGCSITNIHHKCDFTIIPKNKLGQDIFVRVTDTSEQSSVIRMTSGDARAVNVPVSKNMLDSHMEGILSRKLRTFLAVIIADAELPRMEGLYSHQFVVAVSLTSGQLLDDSPSNEQSSRTRGQCSDYSLSSTIETVKWNEIFFFKVNSLDRCIVELEVTDTRNGNPVGYFSAPLKHISRNIQLQSNDCLNELTWIQLLAAENTVKGGPTKNKFGRIRCAIFFSPPPDAGRSGQSKKSGFIQISPTSEGPWTQMRLNYAAPAACWKFGDGMVGSEVVVKDGNRYVNIRSLVSIRNNTDILLDLCLRPKASIHNMKSLDDINRLEELQSNHHIFETKELFETETYNPAVGWVEIPPGGGGPHQVAFGIGLPSGWEWVDDWNLDKQSVKTADGWVYAPDLGSLKWPKSHDPLRFVNYVRQRRWIRTCKQIFNDAQQHISVGPLKPGDTVPLPLHCLMRSDFYSLQLKPLNVDSTDEFSWSSVEASSCQAEDSDVSNDHPQICVSNLTKSENLLHCSRLMGNSFDSSCGLWFCLSIQATEMTKDIHSRSVEDWTLVVRSPLSVTNFLPMAAEFSILRRQPSNFVACSRGILFPGKTYMVHDADIRNSLYFSLLPQRGWLPVNDAVLLCHPSRAPSKSLSLRSSISGRVIQVILEQNHDSEQPLLAKSLRVYAPYWFSITGCQPLTYRLFHVEDRKKTQTIFLPFLSNKNNEVIFTEVTEEEVYNGYTIHSALNFSNLGLSVSIDHSGDGQFGPLRDLSPLGDMDGSLDLSAYNADGNCMRFFVSSKPCPYQSVPTKVICIQPFVTFTNRIGEDMFIKLSIEDEPKILHAFDSRVSLVYRETAGPDKIQVRLKDTEWSYPVHIVKEDTLFLVTRKHDGIPILLRTEVRGYEEGSRFVVVFRPGSTNGPIRFENRTYCRTIRLRQSEISNNSWIQLIPRSTKMFSWEDPYGQKFIDVEVNDRGIISVHKFNLEYTGLHSSEDESMRLQFHVLEVGNMIVARFTEDRVPGPDLHEFIWLLTPAGNWEIANAASEKRTDTLPLKVIIEFGVVGVSVIDHRPKELCYLYLERVCMKFLTGYDGGSTSRFELILGSLQLDNQLPLTIMPVMLAPEQINDIPVLRITISMKNSSADGIVVFPNVSIQVTETLWRFNIDEPIIWALVDFYGNLQLDRLPKTSGVTQVDPEIRIDLIDVSEVRLKISLETAPAQRPIGALGIWGPVLSAVGNALKIQVHLRKVMHRDTFMRRSSVIPAIKNRLWRDLIHNPLHLIFSLDVLGMASSTLSSLSKGFAKLSTDGQFLQLRSNQGRSRKISGVQDGIVQGTEAFAQGVAFGVSGVVTKPIESTRQRGLLGLAHGLGQAFLGFIVQPVSGALDFFSLTVDGIGASCTRCLEVFMKSGFQRIRNPRMIRANGIVTEYSEREAVGQMVLYLAEGSRHFGCTEIFKEPSKYAWSDYYEDHFCVPSKRIVLVTNIRVILLQYASLEAVDKKPSRIMWDVPWDNLMAIESEKAGSQRPSHLTLHLTNFRRGKPFSRVIKCNAEDDSGGREPQAVCIFSVVHKMWRKYLSDVKCSSLAVPSSQKRLSFPASGEKRFVNYNMDFQKIWSSDLELKSKCAFCRKQVSEDSGMCSIWRPVCPDGYVSIGDIARVGSHSPHVSAVYCYTDQLFSPPVSYDLVWRNCSDDYLSPVSIWLPQPPPGFVSLGCVAMANFEEPSPSTVYCVAESLAEEASFEEHMVWMAPDAYPWQCHIYQVQSEALHFVALKQPKEEGLGWKPKRVADGAQPPLHPSEEAE